MDAVWVVIVGSVASAWAATAGFEVGPTFDEPAHLNAGLIAWRTGSNKQLMSWGAMPLPIDIQSFPLYLTERWTGTELKPYLQLDTVLPWARAASLPFFWLVLIYGLRWGRLLGGPWAGRLACALLAADPNLLGHAALATTDLCLTALVLIASYHFYTGRESGWFRRVFVCGILYGVALTAKASALPYVPLLCGLFGACHLWSTGALSGVTSGGLMGRIRTGWVATQRLRWDLAQMIGIGLTWAFAYTGCDWGTEPTFVKWAQQLPAGTLKEWMLPIAERLTIFPNAGEGLIQQVKHNFRGHGGAYLFGTWHHRSVWYYFPAALTVKLPDATLLLLAATTLLRPRGLASPAGLAALVLLLFSLNTRVQIGIRIVFPFMCFLYVALAVAAMRTDDSALSPVRLGRGSWLLRGLAWLAVAVNASEAVSVWPDGLRYANRLHGGPAAAEFLLADSNYDWGQGVPDLRRWWAAHGEPKTVIWYYGGDMAALLPPFAPLHVSTFEVRTPEELTRRAEGRHLAVSVGILRACPDRRPDTLALIDWLNRQEPVGRTPLFVVYRFQPPGATDGAVSPAP